MVYYLSSYSVELFGRFNLYSKYTDWIQKLFQYVMRFKFFFNFPLLIVERSLASFT